MRNNLTNLINYLIKILYLGAGAIIIIFGLISLLIPIIPGFLLMIIGFSITARGSKFLSAYGNMKISDYYRLAYSVLREIYGYMTGCIKKVAKIKRNII